jgi:prepilin-type N-terminal cleavage/methylation domain-containing protein
MEVIPMGGVRAWLHGGADHRGFSLVELLVGIALLGLVALSFYTVHQRTQQSLFGGEQRADMQQNARAAMQAVVAELRAASLVTGTHPDEVVFTSDRYVTGQERRFLLDVDDHDGDGDTSELLLSRSPGDDGSPGPVIDEVAEGISGLSFRYLGDGIGSGSGDEVSEPLAVRRIEVTLEAETLPDGQAGRRTLALTSQVRPRNLGLPLPPATDSLPPAPPTGFAGAATCGTLRASRTPAPAPTRAVHPSTSAATRPTC